MQRVKTLLQEELYQQISAWNNHLATSCAETKSVHPSWEGTAGRGMKAFTWCHCVSNLIHVAGECSLCRSISLLPTLQELQASKGDQAVAALAALDKLLHARPSV